MDMSFENRLKGNITEAIVKALLVDEGYRVIDSGIEHLVREISCLDRREYMELSFADALRKLPDLIVMNKRQDNAHLVEVKYRQSWSPSLIGELEEQVRFLKTSPSFASMAILMFIQVTFQEGHIYVR